MPQLRAKVVAKQPMRRLVVDDHTQVAHHLGPEARIDQVQDGVLHAADVLVDGEPVLDHFRAERRAGVFCVGVAVEVPAGVDEGVHGVCLALGWPAALGTDSVDEGCVARKGGAALLGDLDLLGQQDGELVVGHRDQPIGLAVEHGDGRAPIALAAYAPVFQAVGDLGFTKSTACGDFLQGLLSLRAAQAVVLAGVAEQAVFGDER